MSGRRDGEGYFLPLDAKKVLLSPYLTLRHSQEGLVRKRIRRLLSSVRAKYVPDEENEQARILSLALPSDFPSSLKI